MNTVEKTIVTVEVVINASAEKVWNLWTNPEHITKWNNASDDWHTPTAKNDLRVGGKFSSRMEAKDGSMGFDFGGTYTNIVAQEYIEYVLDDDRKVQVSFNSNGDQTSIKESFEAESTNSVEMQQAGWQAILSNFKKYTEAF